MTASAQGGSVDSDGRRLIHAPGVFWVVRGNQKKRTATERGAAGAEDQAGHGNRVRFPNGRIAVAKNGQRVEVVAGVERYLTRGFANLGDAIQRGQTRD